MADDVGFRRRPHDAERDGFGDGDDQQRAFLVRDVGDGGNVFDDAEEVGRLDQHARGLVGDRLLESFEIDAAVLAVADVRPAACPGACA